MKNKTLMIFLVVIFCLPFSGSAQDEQHYFVLALTNGETRVATSMLKANPSLANLPVDYGCGGECPTLYPLPLHCAAAYGHYDIVDVLIKYKAKVNQRTEESTGTDSGWTPLQVAIFKHNYLIADLLIQNKADVNARFFCNSCNGGTLLHLAVDRGDLYMAEYLLKKGALANAGDIDRKTPLCYNGKSNYREMKLLLEEYGGKAICEPPANNTANNSANNYNTTHGISFYDATNEGPSLLSESINGIKFGDSIKLVIKNLGQPETKSKLERDPCYSSQDYGYPSKGIEFSLAFYYQGQGATVQNIRVFGQSLAKTSKQIGIGSSREDVEKAYGKPENLEDINRWNFFDMNHELDLTFKFEENKVSEIIFYGMLHCGD